MPSAPATIHKRGFNQPAGAGAVAGRCWFAEGFSTAGTSSARSTRGASTTGARAVADAAADRTAGVASTPFHAPRQFLEAGVRQRARPPNQVRRLDVAERERNHDIIEQRRNEDSPPLPFRRFFAHPARLSRIAGPQHDHASGLVQRRLDHSLENLSRFDSSVPPDGPTPCHQSFHHRLDSRQIFPRVAEKNVAHVLGYYRSPLDLRLPAYRRWLFALLE